MSTIMRPQVNDPEGGNGKLYKNIPILPEAFLTFASKSSNVPSYAANGQEDHKTYTNLKVFPHPVDI